MAKFKVGQMVEDFERYGVGIVSAYVDGRISVKFQNYNYPVPYMPDGRYFDSSHKDCLRLTGRPFNIGDRVVIGGEKGVITEVYPFNRDVGPTPVRVDMGVDNVWITKDGRAWPGTPIICEHDWEEEEETKNKEEAQEIDDVTVSAEEVRHIADMQEQKAIDDVVNVFNVPPQVIGTRSMTEIDTLKEQYKYARMALKLTGFDVDNEAAALITETVKKVLELVGEFSIKTACEIEARVNQMYDETNI